MEIFSLKLAIEIFFINKKQALCSGFNQPSCLKAHSKVWDNFW